VGLQRLTVHGEAVLDDPRHLDLVVVEWTVTMYIFKWDWNMSIGLARGVFCGMSIGFENTTTIHAPRRRRYGLKHATTEEPIYDPRAYLQAAVRWHFSPETDSPYWLKRRPDPVCRWRIGTVGWS